MACDFSLVVVDPAQPQGAHTTHTPHPAPHKREEGRAARQARQEGTKEEERGPKATRGRDAEGKVRMHLDRANKPHYSLHIGFGPWL